MGGGVSFSRGGCQQQMLRALRKPYVASHPQPGRTVRRHTPRAVAGCKGVQGSIFLA